MDRLQAGVHVCHIFLRRFAFVTLRIPGLFIFELYYRLHWANPEEHSLHGDALNHKVHNLSEQFDFPLFLKQRNLDQPAVQVLGYAALLFAICLLIIPFMKLISIYLHIVALFLIAFSHYLSTDYVAKEQNMGGEVILDDFSKLERHGFYVLAQVSIAALISFFLHLKNPIARAALTVYVSPAVARTCGLPLHSLQMVHNFACSFTMLNLGFYILNLTPHMVSYFRSGVAYCRTLIRLHGFTGAAAHLSSHLMFSEQLAAFWLFLCASQVYIFCTAGKISSFGAFILLAVLSEACCTPTGLLGLCVVISYAAFVILALTKLLLDGFQGLRPLRDEVLLHCGYAEGVTIFVLAFQTHLIALSSEKRAVLLGIILFVVLASVLQSMYDIVDPYTLRVAAAHAALSQHVKVLALTVVLIVFPLGLCLCVASMLPLDFWLIVILTSCVLTSVQALGSLAVYCLFMYDGWRREPWEHLDDYIFACRTVTRSLELVVALLVIGYGMYESVFGAWPYTNIIILGVHFYFNVYSRVYGSMQTLKLRREAADLIERFPPASAEQLAARRDDVCAICYQNMTAARVTPCEHMFHGACLRRWLNVKQACPLCHGSLSSRTTEHQHDGHGFEAEDSADEEGSIVLGIVRDTDTESLSDLTSNGDTDSLLTGSDSDDEAEGSSGSDKNTENSWDTVSEHTTDQES